MGAECFPVSMRSGERRVDLDQTSPVRQDVDSGANQPARGTAFGFVVRSSDKIELTILAISVLRLRLIVVNVIYFSRNDPA